MVLNRIQEEHYAQEEALLFCSLCLLDAHAGEGSKQVELSKTMFRKPNAKALEFILYLAYGIANGKAAAKKVSLQLMHSRAQHWRNMLTHDTPALQHSISKGFGH